jgi:arylsulfatase A-like enzyme
MIVAGFSQAVSMGAERKPNLVVIHTDEHTFRTLGCYRALMGPDEAFVWGDGVAVATPHIDALAAGGAICTRFYAASPVCTPSRASFVSGRYPQNTGAIQNNLPLLDDVVTFAEVLRRQGYATGYAGKWHLDGLAKPGWTPARQFGFADNRYMFNRGHWKQLHETAQGPRVKAVNAKGQPTYAVEGADATSFTTDFLADRTVEFIRAHRNEPFCYMVSLPDPHGPNSVRPPYDTMFDGLKFQQPRSAKMPGENLPSWASVKPDKFNSRQMAQYFGMVKCIDDNVGKIVDALRDAGVLERTIVVFTADHGDLCGEHGRHNKGVPLEASARIPFVIQWPGQIKSGAVIRTALTTADFKPTILALMNAPRDERDEGRDASALFAGDGVPANWKDRAFVRIGGVKGGRNGWFGVFTSRYKLVLSPWDDPCLFDLETDPHEMRNVLGVPGNRDTVRELARALETWARQYHEPLASDPSVRADLAWATEGSGPYVPPQRAKAARTRKK